MYRGFNVIRSDSFEADTDHDNVKPAAKKSKATKPQAAVIPVDSMPSKNHVGLSKARPRVVSGAKRALAKKKATESEMEEDNSFTSVPAPAPRETAPKRAARGAVKKYVEIESDEIGEAADDSFVVDSD